MSHISEADSEASAHSLQCLSHGREEGLARVGSETPASHGSVFSGHPSDICLNQVTNGSRLYWGEVPGTASKVEKGEKGRGVSHHSTGSHHNPPISLLRGLNETIEIQPPAQCAVASGKHRQGSPYSFLPPGPRS